MITAMFTCTLLVATRKSRGLSSWLSRPRLVCQESGLRPTGLSPGVPDESSRGLGALSGYSAQILICFIAYISHFLFLCGFSWNFAGLPLFIVTRMRLAIRQSKLPACLARVQLAHQNNLWHLCHRLMKLTDKMHEICINGKFSVQEPSESRVFCIPVSNFTVIQPRI